MQTNLTSRSPHVNSDPARPEGYITIMRGIRVVASTDPALNPCTLDHAIDDRPSEADRQWLASLNADWHDPEPMGVGYTGYDDTRDFEAEAAIERYLRPRARSMRFDLGDELARWGGHPG